MKRLAIFALFILTAATSTAQDYKPTWESLDSRPVPQWFKDSKFGIFIHWGVYAVPGWSTKGNYAEWYQYGLQTNDTARKAFHQKKFGNRTYYQLADDFKAELFNPEEWAKVFEQSGAKYIVLTSKHHDGFALWPSNNANQTWGFKWNAVDAGPHRDLLGDLFKAVRKTSVHPGMYYSLYEWFNPLWKQDKKKYAAEHAWPQMKELINNYQPDVFWTDGDWEADDETWKSREFLSWLYNQSPVKNSVVTYDRWGSGIRFKHGAVYTPEYQPDLDFEDHYWEESRGMGFSYGYNREEDAWDYNSAQSLVLQLIDKVSRGGNFLLDIGPDEHGKIPPIMQERLLQIGDWLKLNGEAIYHTTKWKVSSQWSEGKMGYKPASGSGDLLLKLTVDPDPGYAVKEVFYTYNETENNLYAILPKYPSGKKISLKGMTLPAGTKISLPAIKQDIQWRQTGADVEISLPEYDPNTWHTNYAYVIKIGNFGAYVKKPKINVTYPQGGFKPLINIDTEGVEAIRYTTDGSEPDLNSNLYTKPFAISHSAIIKTRAYQAGMLPSAMASREVKVYEWMPAVTANPKPGIMYRYFESNGHIDMGLLAEKETARGVVNSISVSPKQRSEKFALQFDGYIKVDKDAVYEFYLASDDGSKLFIDNDEVINNDGDHGTEEKEGKAALKKGFHHIRVDYFDSGGGNELVLMFREPGGEKKLIPAGMLFH